METIFAQEIVVAKSIGLAGTVVLAVTLVGCGGSDARLKKLTVGIPRDSALRVTGLEKPERTDRYLVGGHFIEAMYFAKPGADSGKTPDRQMSPVVVVDGKLAAWGWKTWDSIAAANKIVVAK
jgi:hypothetical protein